MDYVFDDFPRVLHQVSGFDVLPENAIPFAHQYKQMYPCPACCMFLPYEGCDHRCTAVLEEEDEGFHEHDDYLNDFHTFCVDSARYRNVDLFYRCSEREIHIVAPPIGDIDDDDFPDFPNPEPEEDEPDVMIVGEEIEVIEIESDDEEEEEMEVIEIESDAEEEEMEVIENE